MDSNVLAVIIVAAIVLAGTVTVVILWRRQPKLDTSTQVRLGPGKATTHSEKQAVYVRLWNKTETLHALLQRQEDLSTVEFRALLGEIDDFIMQQAPLFDQQDSELARRYLAALRTFKEQIDPPAEVGKGENVQETRRLPRELYTRTGEMLDSARTVEQLRGELLARFHIIINANV